MRGEDIDIGVVSPGLVEQILQRMAARMAEPPRMRVGIMGESGSGKTVLAHALRHAVEDRGRRAVVIQLDDYFRYPPRDNEARRRADIAWVGPDEVDRARLDDHLARIAAGAPSIEKPLVDYPNNVILQETLDLAGIDLAIVEGTYVGTLHNVDFRIFIDRTHEDTRAARLARGREAQDPWLESVLAIEHRYVSAHRDRADLVIDRDYQVRP